MIVCGALTLSALSRVLPAAGEVAEVLKNPRREEFASRAIRMFSSVRKLPDGEVGDSEREVGLR